ncbi:MAG: hypothetical protein LBT97_13160 [Planctomycetota bacterium]|jgi:hypothetical protein|nr:hypothetical protein [Planctomycetota bacterium]
MATKALLFNETPFVPYLARADQVDAALDLPDGDVRELRELARHYAEAADNPLMPERIRLWERINDLEGGRPLVWLNEVCWHEMNVDGELTLRCASEVGRRIESELRKALYQWRHMPADMVIEPVLHSPFIMENSGFGIAVEADVRETDSESAIASRHFHTQIRELADVGKVKDPVITVDAERTEAFYQEYSRIFKGILPVEKRGATGFWFAPWDDIVYWMGAEEVLFNLVDNPDLMHALMRRLMDAYRSALDQWTALGASGSNNANVRVGSGGYGYTRELPRAAGSLPPTDAWGACAAQIFGSVSPDMHKEFGIDYEIEWLRRFGLAYYGCCEPLSGRVDILAAIPNLRKISISPWADEKAAAESMRGRYVVSLKPTPSHFASPVFDGKLVERELREKLGNLKGCCVEVIMKDISTVNYDPSRLWRWTEIAMRVVEEFG